MFRTFNNLMKAAIGVAIFPFDGVADVLTWLCKTRDDGKLHVVKRAKHIQDCIDEVTSPDYG